MKFTKPAISIQDQLELLKSRGLNVPNENRAKHYLHKIGYYRFSSYTYAFNNQPSHNFKPNKTFNEVLELYLFDRELRLLVFDKIEKIEIAFRSSIVNHMSLKYGSHWYENSSLFKNWYKHTDLINTIKNEVGRSKEVFIKHYNSTYTQPVLPPSWMTFELLTFGQLSNIYKALPNVDKQAIASGYNLHPKSFESWFLTINYIRNTCAHHSRLWNRELGIKPSFPKNQKLETIAFRNNRIYSILFLIKYLLNTITPSSNFKNQIKELLERAPFDPNTSMGIPQDWETDPVWNAQSKQY